MITYYCPNCWEELSKQLAVCPHCSFPLEQYNALSYEEKLSKALHHPLHERRIMAAEVLGKLAYRQAMPIFKEIIESEKEDYFFLAAILKAVSKIDHPDQMQILRRATHHPAPMVASLAQELLDSINRNRQG